jgi:hypothetical protein
MYNPVMYILMRTDLGSLNSGKAMAQAAHASNALEAHFETTIQSAITSNDPAKREKMETLNAAYHKWKSQTPQGFGTTIVLGAHMSLISLDVRRLREFGYLSGIVHDPTYPITDGSVTHLIPLDTCAYVFAPDKNDPNIRMTLESYDLHP